MLLSQLNNAQSNYHVIEKKNELFEKNSQENMIVMESLKSQIRQLNKNKKLDEVEAFVKEIARQNKADASESLKWFLCTFSGRKLDDRGIFIAAEVTLGLISKTYVGPESFKMAQLLYLKTKSRYVIEKLTESLPTGSYSYHFKNAKDITSQFIKRTNGFDDQ